MPRMAVQLFSSLNPNRLLDRYSAERNGADSFLISFIFLLASCFSFVLDLARYAFELTTNHLLNYQVSSSSNDYLGLNKLEVNRP